MVKVDTDAIEAALRAADRDRDAVPSGYYHREASHVAKTLLIAAAAENRDILLECVGDETGRMLARARLLTKAGYQVEVYGVALDPQEATMRALSRWWRDGRRNWPWVPLAYILMHVGRLPEKTYWALKRSGLASHGQLFDSSAAGGIVMPEWLRRPEAVSSPIEGHHRAKSDDGLSSYLAEVEQDERDTDEAIEAILRRKGFTDQEIADLKGPKPEHAEAIRLGEEDFWREG